MATNARTSSSAQPTKTTRPTRHRAGHGSGFASGVAIIAALVLITPLALASVVGASAGPAGAYIPTQKLFQADAGPSHGFGTAVAAEGDTLVVGATDPSGDGVGLEAVYVYERSTVGPWELIQTLSPPSTSTAGFGWSVALDGESLVVGAPWTATAAGNFAGAVHIYEREATGWTHVAQLEPFEGDAFDSFGTSVAIGSGTIFAGAPGSSTVYAFEISASGGWTQVASFQASGVGESLSVAAGSAAVGGQARVHLLERVTAGWVAAGVVEPDGSAPGFGRAVGLSEDLLVVGAPGEKTTSDAVLSSSAASGSAYVFTRDGPRTWEQVTRLVPLDLNPAAWSAGFGRSVDVAHGRALVGAPFDNPAPGSPTALPSQGVPCAPAEPDWCQRHGATYLFREDSTSSWTQTAKLTAPDGSQWDRFGSSGTLTEAGAVVGAPADDLTLGETATSLDQDVGAAYAFTIVPGGDV